MPIIVLHLPHHGRRSVTPPERFSIEPIRRFTASIASSRCFPVCDLMLFADSKLSSLLTFTSGTNRSAPVRQGLARCSDRSRLCEPTRLRARAEHRYKLREDRPFEVHATANSPPRQFRIRCARHEVQCSLEDSCDTLCAISSRDHSPGYREPGSQPDQGV